MANPRVVVQINGADLDPNSLLVLAAPQEDGSEQLLGASIAPPPVPEMLPLLMHQLIATNQHLIPHDAVPALRAFAVAILNNLGAPSHAQPNNPPLQ